MILLTLAGILCIAYGIGALISPRLMQSVSNLVRGDSTEPPAQQEGSRSGRLLQGLGMILLGLAMLSIPFLIWQW